MLFTMVLTKQNCASHPANNYKRTYSGTAVGSRHDGQVPAIPLPVLNVRYGHKYVKTAVIYCCSAVTVVRCLLSNSHVGCCATSKRSHRFVADSSKLMVMFISPRGLSPISQCWLRFLSYVKGKKSAEM